ncbi:MAG: hypothetical protein M1829_001328 [Trizodia sp. TS-e1964]|nr:MAG: hypothetical protein M1829_001328 [Trizodia sp. TS-e1964]
MPGKRVTIRVGEKTFNTTYGTLTQESRYFEHFLDNTLDNQDGDCYFLDADPILFEHILRYLRRGLLPVFYDNAKGHDHALYLALLEEARIFQIDRLQLWLETKGYLKAIGIGRAVEEVQGVEDIEKTLTERGGSIEAIYPKWRTEQSYLCPREIFVHNGNRSACGRQCAIAQGTDPIAYEEISKTLVVMNTSSLDEKLCLQGRLFTN